VAAESVAVIVEAVAVVVVEVEVETAVEMMPWAGLGLGATGKELVWRLVGRIEVAEIEEVGVEVILSVKMVLLELWLAGVAVWRKSDLVVVVEKPELAL